MSNCLRVLLPQPLGCSTALDSEPGMKAGKTYASESELSEAWLGFRNPGGNVCSCRATALIKRRLRSGNQPYLFIRIRGSQHDRGGKNLGCHLIIKIIPIVRG